MHRNTWCSNTIIVPVANRANVQVNRFQTSKRCARLLQGSCRSARHGPNSFARTTRTCESRTSHPMPPLPRCRPDDVCMRNSSRDRQVEAATLHFVIVDDLAHSQSDRIFTLQRLACSLSCGDDLIQIFFRRLEQFFTLASPLLASSGFRHTISRSPGKCSSSVISARSFSSNSVRSILPAATSDRMPSDRSAEIHSSPSTSRRSSLMRFVVIMPRSPTNTTFVMPNRLRTCATMRVNAFGSAVLPGNTSTAIGRPSGSHSRP